jgi:hypothetical protein
VADAIKPPFTVPSECTLRREDQTARPRSRGDAFKEGLPGCIAHLSVKRKVAPAIYTGRHQTQLKLDWIQEAQRCASTQQEVGVRVKANMHALQAS